MQSVEVVARRLRVAAAIWARRTRGIRARQWIASHRARVRLTNPRRRGGS